MRVYSHPNMPAMTTLYLPAGVELDGAKLEFVTNGVPPDPYEQRIIEAGAIQPRGGHVDEDETPFEAQLADFNPGAMRRALGQVMQNGPCEVPGCFVCSGPKLDATEWG